MDYLLAEDSERVEWRVIPGYSGFYEVSSDGRVRSFFRGRGRRVSLMPKADVPHVLSPKIHSGGYLVVCLRCNGKRTMALIHRLVLEAFVGPAPKGYQCAHLNGIPGDCRLSNLAWVTPGVNSSHRSVHGTDSGKLTLRRRAIMLLLENGWPIADVAEVTDSTIPQVENMEKLRQRLLAIDRGKRADVEIGTASDDLQSRVQKLECLLRSMLGNSPDGQQAVV